MMQTKKLSFLSIPRIMVISGHTFTQLVRMKVFYFLGIFALLLLGMQWVEMPYEQGAGLGLDQNLRLLKSAGFFAMNLFAMILALSATALLLPKDVEDRTLYTILCKPVPRLDYLLGKLFGVLSLIFISLVVMDGLFCVILNSRVEGLVAERMASMERAGRSAEYISYQVEAIRAQGVTLDLQVGVLAVFLKAMVVASIALLVSTFSTSTIFTIVITVIVMLIAGIQAEAREYYHLQQALGTSTPMAEVTRWVALMFPDFQLLGIEDGVIEGREISASVIGRVSLIAVLYAAIYTVLSWFVFRRKEL